MARTLTHHVSFRTSAQNHLRLTALKATFPDMTWGEAFRWLLDEPAVRAVVDERLAGHEPDKPMGAADFSLPIGDR